MMDKSYSTILLERDDHVLRIKLNRPKNRNAMSMEMVEELGSVFRLLQTDLSVRAVELRGEGGHFCAGGDIKDMAAARTANTDGKSDPFFELNSAFGKLITQLNQLPQVVIAVLEGAVLGGGFGLACVTDVAITTSTAKFGMPETTLGVPPAQIAPFVVKRIGLTQARRLALLGSRFDGQEAVNLGIAHFYAHSEEDVQRLLGQILDQVKQCAPNANAVTKLLMLKAAEEPAESLIDDAARAFSHAVQSEEGIAGSMAFIKKEPAPWS